MRWGARHFLGFNPTSRTSLSPVNNTPEARPPTGMEDEKICKQLTYHCYHNEVVQETKPNEREGVVVAHWNRVQRSNMKREGERRIKSANPAILFKRRAKGGGDLSHSKWTPEIFGPPRSFFYCSFGSPPGMHISGCAVHAAYSHVCMYWGQF